MSLTVSSHNPGALTVVGYRGAPSRFALLLIAVALLAAPCDAFFKSWGYGAKVRRASHSSEPAGAYADDTAVDNEAPVPVGAVGAMPPALQQRAKEVLSEYRAHASFSACWKEAVETLERTCAESLTDEDTRSRMALAFTACQLRSDGKPELARDCPASYSLPACTGQLDDRVYMVYLQYRIHVDTLCFYVQQELFQARSASAVSRLQGAAQSAGAKIVALARKADDSVAALAVLHRQQLEAVDAARNAVASIEALRGVEERLQETLREKVRPIEEIGQRLDGLATKQDALESGQEKAAKAAEDRAAQHMGVLSQIASGAKTLRVGIDDAKAAVATLAKDQVAASKSLHGISSGLKTLESAHLDSAERAKDVARQVAAIADAAEARMAAQIKLLDALQEQTAALALQSQRHHAAVAESSGDLLVGLSQVRDFQEHLAAAIISIEAAAFYVAACSLVILFTVPARTAGARFPALVLGPLTCFLFERFLMREVVVIAVRLRLGPDPWGAARGALLSPAAVSTFINSHYVPPLRMVFGAVVVALLIRAARRYETPEAVQRRVVRQAVFDAVAEAFADSRAIGGTNGEAKKPRPPALRQSGSTMSIAEE
jgi:hypothetical protein